jgi:hypothetical protein
MQDRMEESRLRDTTQGERARLSARERELQEFREFIETQQREFDEYRKRAQDEQLKREASFRSELEKREKMFSQRESKLIERQREVEERLAGRQAKAELLRERLETEIVQREAQINAAMVALNQEKERYNDESRKKIERTSKDYVSDAIQTLSNKEREFHRISKIWSFVGAIGLSVAIVFLVYLSFSTVLALPTDMTWELIVFSSLKGLVVAMLLAGLAKYSFLFSRSYMQEALKNADRRHAINFGKFYLESYGAAADWSQVKDAFEHWNIPGTNAFAMDAPNALELSSLEKVVNLVERASKSLPKRGEAGLA